MEWISGIRFGDNKNIFLVWRGLMLAWQPARPVQEHWCCCCFSMGSLRAAVTSPQHGLAQHLLLTLGGGEDASDSDGGGGCEGKGWPFV